MTLCYNLLQANINRLPLTEANKRGPLSLQAKWWEQTVQVCFFSFVPQGYDVNLTFWSFLGQVVEGVSWGLNCVWADSFIFELCKTEVFIQYMNLYLDQQANDVVFNATVHGHHFYWVSFSKHFGFLGNREERDLKIYIWLVFTTTFVNFLWISSIKTNVHNHCLGVLNITVTAGTLVETSAIRFFWLGSDISTGCPSNSIFPNTVPWEETACNNEWPVQMY